MATKTKRTPAQQAATKRMLAANRAKHAPAKKKTSHAKHHTTRHTPAKVQTVVVRTQAPAVHTVQKKKPSTAHKARAAAGKAMAIGKSLIGDVVVPVAIGGTAASIVDVAYGAIRQFLPADYVDHPIAKPVVKTIAGIALAMGAQKLGAKPAHAKAAAVGVGIVQVHNVINAAVSKNTKLNLNGVGMTVGDLAAVLPNELNGLEALGAVMVNDESLGGNIPYARAA